MYTKWFKRYLKYRLKLGGYNAMPYSGTIPSDMFLRHKNGTYWYINPNGCSSASNTLDILLEFPEFNNSSSAGSVITNSYCLCTDVKNELSYSYSDSCPISVVSKSKTATFDTTNNSFKIQRTTIITSKADKTINSIVCTFNAYLGTTNTLTPTEAQIHCDDNDSFDGSVINSVSLSTSTSSAESIKEFFNLETPLVMTSGTSYTITMTKYIDVSGVVKETDITIV